MRKKYKMIAIFAAAIILITGCQAPVTAESEPQLSQPVTTYKQLNDQLIMGTLWMQKSAEYRALCYQAYNMAWTQAQLACAFRRDGDKPLAMVFDCDETLVDSGAHTAAFIGSDVFYYKSGGSIYRWLSQQEVEKPLPGALDLLKKLESKNIEVFYVTNRMKSTGYESTIRHFKKMGFPNVDEKHVLLNTPEEKSNKRPRFDAIAKDYNVIAYVGDNIGDFPINSEHKNMEQRSAIIDEHQREFGTKLIVLPNPCYGSWEVALDKNYLSATPAEKDKINRKLLNRWTGFDK